MKKRIIYSLILFLIVIMINGFIKENNQQFNIEVNESKDKKEVIHIQKLEKSEETEREKEKENILIANQIKIIKTTFEVVKADKYEAGFSSLRVRGDFVDDYNMMKKEINDLGGIITSSGGVRDLEIRKEVGRSSTSLHYLGRAIDLYTETGMLHKESPYIITKDGATDEEPYWKIYCRTNNKEIPLQKIDAYFWGSGNDPFVMPIEDRFICITDILEKYGWNRISSNAHWKDEYMNVEWWHFQREDKLIDGQTTFKDELTMIYEDEMIDNSVSKENQEKVWNKDEQRFN